MPKFARFERMNKAEIWVNPLQVRAVVPTGTNGLFSEIVFDDQELGGEGELVEGSPAEVARKLSWALNEEMGDKD